MSRRARIAAPVGGEGATLLAGSLLLALLVVVTPLSGCAGLRRPGRPASLRAVESVIPGVPVPEGSELGEGGMFDGGEGVAMVFYTHPRLQGSELLEFYDRVMPEWGWSVHRSEVLHKFQRAYVKEGVPIIIGVDKREGGVSFSILKGVSGDWGYMAPLRGSS